MLNPMKNRHLRVTFAKDEPQGTDLVIPNVNPEEIEMILRRSVLDLTKLAVAAIGSLMILHTTLEIVEQKATSDKE